MKTLDSEFIIFWCERANENWGVWPSNKSWPTVGVGYTAFQKRNGKAVETILKFDNEVDAGEYNQGKKFKVAGKKLLALRTGF